MNFGRGLLRLGLAIIGVWFVFWTYAYILNPETSGPQPGGELIARLTDWQLLIPLIVLAVLLGWWTVAGFRSRSSH